MLRKSSTLHRSIIGSAAVSIVELEFQVQERALEFSRNALRERGYAMSLDPEAHFQQLATLRHRALRRRQVSFFETKSSLTVLDLVAKPAIQTHVCDAFGPYTTSHEVIVDVGFGCVLDSHWLALQELSWQGSLPNVPAHQLDGMAPTINSRVHLQPRQGRDDQTHV